MIAIISDIHSNLEALEAVIDDIGKRKIEKILCCGDVVGYAANPNECVEMIKELDIPCVMGNHDYAIAKNSSDVLGWFNDYARQAILWTRKNMKKENIDFLGKLPESRRMQIDGNTIFLVHGSPRDQIFEYIYPDVPDITLKNFLKETKSDVLVLGHTHIQFVRMIDNKIAMNPGSVGQPRDGNPNASYAILDNREVKLIRIKYDIRKTSDKILEAGLSNFLAERLFLGY